MTCPNCGSDHVTVQAVAEQKKRGCLQSALAAWYCLSLCLRARAVKRKVTRFVKIAGINGGYNGTVLQYSCVRTAARNEGANSSAMGA